MFRPTWVLSVTSLLITAAIGFGSYAYAAGSGSMNTPSMPAPSKSMTTEEKAVAIYNQGVGFIKEADGELAEAAEAAQANNVKKQEKEQSHAKKYFTKAQEKFKDAVELKPDMFQAWNYIGYSKRNLGDYNGALEAYNQALKLNPKYLEAIEYRGHAYLGLNRLDDAKQSYLDLFSSNSALAKKLLVAMQSWVSSHRNDAQGVDSTTLENFASWVNERSAIAVSTAGLAPKSNTETWH